MMNEVVFFIPQMPQQELENVRKMAYFMGYKVKAFAHTIEDLKAKMLKWNPFYIMLWDYKSVEGCTEFFNLMTQFQQHFYDFQRGEAHYPAGVNYFMVRDHIGQLIGEEQPLRFYQIQ